MSPDLVNLLTTSILPALAAFVVGHFHLVLPAPKTPVVPGPAAPAVIRPIGQGGIIDVLGLLVSQVLQSSATPANKLAAVTKVAELTELVKA